MNTMNQYQRYITYLYQQGEMTAEKAIGFAKVERHLDRMRIQIQVRGCQSMDGRWPVYLCGKNGERRQIDFLQIRKGLGARTILLQTQDEEMKEIEIGEGSLLIAGAKAIEKRNQNLKNAEETPEIHAAQVEETGCEDCGGETFTNKEDSREDLQESTPDEEQHWESQQEYITKEEQQEEHQEPEDELVQASCTPKIEISERNARPIQIQGNVFFIRRIRMAEMPPEWQHMTKDSFLLHAYFQHGYIYVGKCQQTGRWLIGVPGTNDCTSELAAKTHGFNGFYPRKTRAPFPMSGFWFRIQE